MRTRLMRGKFTLLFMMLGLLLAVPAIAFAQDVTGSTTSPVVPTIQSDLPDYAPGDTVTLTGSNWQPGEVVHINVNDNQTQPWSRDVDVTADASGNITDQFQLPTTFAALYNVTATGPSSGTATTTFTDGNVRILSSPLSSVSGVTWKKFINGNSTCSGSPSSSSPAGGVTITDRNNTTFQTAVDSGESLEVTVPQTAGSPGRSFFNWTGDVTSSSSTVCIAGNNNTQSARANYNQAPVANPQTVSTNVNTAKLITLSATDADNDSLTYTITGSLPVNGTLYRGDATNPANQTNANRISNSSRNVNGTLVTYVPASGFSGTNTFGFVANDGTADSNTATVTINVTSDTTAPTSSATATVPDGDDAGTDPDPYSSGTWTNKDVTVTLSGQDNAGGSGFKEIRYTLDGTTPNASSTLYTGVITRSSTTTVKFLAYDNAGNAGTVNTFEVKIDKVTPTVGTATATVPDGDDAGTDPDPYSSGTWTNKDVKVSWSCTDAASGSVNANGSQTVSSEGASGSVTPSCEDQAGNTASGPAFSPIKIDKTKPVISQDSVKSGTLGLNDWYTTDVGYGFTASDPNGANGSGLAAADQAFTKSTTGEGSAVHVSSGTVKDKAGNEATAINSPDFKIDKTKPTLNPTVSPNPVLLYGAATASAGANDATSGVDSSKTGCDDVNTNTIGAGQTVSCHATDNAGHTNTANATYSVGAGFVGWLQPVDGNGTAAGAVNVGKTGRTYPIKWQLKDANGNLISDTAAQALVSSMSGTAKNATCGNWSNLGTDLLEDYTTGNTALRYDATSDQFIYNYKAPSSPACQAFVVSKADGLTAKQANFQFTK